MIKTDVLIIGASASGLMCAAVAGQRGRKVIVLDHANKAGKKILMSGGGRCNFTNYSVEAENFISHNSHFCKSALSRFTQWDFIAMVERYRIAYHERDHGQLFCDNSAKDILNMLLDECAAVNAEVRLNTEIKQIQQQADHHFIVRSSRGDYHCQSLVIATGGLSIPSMGATPFGYKIAEQFGLNVKATRAGLVPFTLHVEDKQRFAPLSGIAVNSRVSNPRASFRENILFTHRGLSGPAILQISSYWLPGEHVTIDLLPDTDLAQLLFETQKTQPQQLLRTLLNQHLPKRLITALVDESLLAQPLQHLSRQQQQIIVDALKAWSLKPNGTEGYRTAEVTLGGVDCDDVSSKTMEAKQVDGLYFIGEVLDVSGWLGGYNFQWAWASGWAAGQAV